MPVATSQPTKRKKMTSLVLVILVLSTGLISAGVLILLNQNQAPQTPAAAPSCPATGAYCQWADNQDGVSYKYKIVDKKTGEVKMTGQINSKRVDFDFKPEIDHTYQCIVTPVNVCGEGPENTAEVSCSSTQQTSQIEVTPTVEPTSTTEASPSGELNGTPTATLSGSLTPPIGGSESSPSATPVLIVKATNTPGPSPTNTPVTTAAPTAEMASLPEAGNWIPSLAILSLAIGIITIGLIL